ncbi:MAG: fused MFS/spermidine synthase, partial [Planctomycetota bacterium]
AQPDVAVEGYWAQILLNTTLRALMLILPPTVIMGYLFPMIVSLYASQKAKLGSQVGRVVAINTLGAIVGSIASGFVLIPLCGIQMSLLLFAILSGLTGIVAFGFGPLSEGARKKALAGSLPVLLLAFWSFPFEKQFGFTQLAGHEKAELLFYSESADQTVIVTRDLGSEKVQRLLLNQQQATSTVLEGQRKNQLLGHLPMWACPRAKDALVICFGSGGTFGALGLYDLESVVCVDLCPTVLEAAYLFKEWNNDVLSQPNVRVVHDDGRSYLLTTSESYDIITLEPMHPGLKGVSSLYSLEFYEEARSKLNPGGVLCQWIPLYNMSDEDGRILIATAVEVFPQSTLWLIGAEGVLMCTNTEPSIQWDWLKSKFLEERINKALTRVRIDDPWAILSGYLMGPDGLKAFLKDVPLMDDDRPFTEYSIPRHQHLSPWHDILLLSEKRESPLPLLRGIDTEELKSLESGLARRREGWIERDRGFAAFSQKELGAARMHLETAIEKDPSDRYTAFFLQKIYRFFGDNFSRHQRYEDALLAYSRALQLEPDDADLFFFRAMVYAHLQKPQQAREDANRALKICADHEGARQLLEKLDAPR